MRLIDADALKRKFRNVNEGVFQMSRIYELIDNAPTVEEITNEDIQQAIKEGFANGYEMAKAKFERPTGEWVILDGGDRGCPFCNTATGRESNASLVFFNYCPYCGADMRGEDNEA